MTFPAALSALGTRISFLTLAWLMLAGSMSLRDVAIVSSAQLAGYLVFRQVAERVSPVALGADLLSMLTLGVAAFFTGDLLVLAALAGLLGAQRGFGDRSTDTPPASTDDAARREGLARFGLVLLGLLAGAAAMWLGPLGLLWANAMVFAAAAVLRVLARKPEVVEGETAAATESVFELRGDPLVRRLALTLFATNLFAQAAAVLLVVLWVGEVTRSPQLLGLVGTAFLFGFLAAALANAGLVRSIPRLFLFGLAVLVGGGALFLLDGRPAALLLVVVAALVTGVATASVIPVITTMLSSHVPVSLRSRVDGMLSSVSYLGIPLGTAGAAWLLGRGYSVAVGLAAAAGALLVALLIPVFTFRTWRQMMPDAPTVRGQAKLPARLTVTLAYTNGQWVVEVRRGRALLGSRHLVRSAEALNMLSILDVPGVRDSVEKALAVDQTEANRQAERMRTELSELEAKLAGLTEMVEITEAHKPAPKQREESDAEVKSSS